MSCTSGKPVAVCLLPLLHIPKSKFTFVYRKIVIIRRDQSTHINITSIQLHETHYKPHVPIFVDKPHGGGAAAGR